MNHIYAIIMAGGVGTRFWPFSRNNYPKQFHDVLGTGKTLLQQTAARFEGVCPPENIYIVTSADYFGLVKEQLPFLSDDQILCEPHRRNTAACIAYACYKIGSRDSEATVVVAPSDHLMLREDIFRERVNVALEAARQAEVLVTLGIQPSRPDTGYGYIQFEASEAEVKKVKSFREKPNAETAAQFLDSGDYVWNAGIFIWRVKTIQAAFAKHVPEMAATFAAGNADYYTEREKVFLDSIYADCQSISIDYAIMEKSDNVFVVLSDFGWSDLGAWKALYDASAKDEAQNAAEGQLMLYETQNCIIKTPKDKLVVVQGLDGYIVAEHDGVLMICKMEEEQRVKEFVNAAQRFGNQYV
jgi:mannose-1-phosphate guanylyltransferase